MFVPVVAFWVGDDKPTPYQVRDVTSRGGFIATPQRWYPGSILMMTFRYDPYYLQATEITGNVQAAIRMRAKVVHHGNDGVGVQFIYLNDGERRTFEKFLAGGYVRGTE